MLRAHRAQQVEALLQFAGLLQSNGSIDPNGPNINRTIPHVDFPFGMQVFLTVFSYLNILVFIAISVGLIIYSRFKPNFAKRYSVFYITFSCFGILVMYHDGITNIWAWMLGDAVWVRITWIFYFLGFPLVFAPIIVRSWRVVCTYKQTPKLLWCYFGWDEPLTKTRDFKWVSIRVVVLLIPYFLLFPFVFASEWVDVGLIPLQFFLLAINVILAVMQFSFRKQLNEKDITQYRSLIIFNVILVIYYIYDNIAYYILMKIYDIYMWPQIGYIIWYNILYFFLTIDVILTATKQEISNASEKKSSDGGEGHDSIDNDLEDNQNHPVPHQPEKPKDDYEDYFSGDRLVISASPPNLNAVSPSLNFAHEQLHKSEAEKRQQQIDDANLEDVKL